MWPSWKSYQQKEITLIEKGLCSKVWKEHFTQWNKVESLGNKFKNKDEDTPSCGPKARRTVWDSNQNHCSFKPAKRLMISTANGWLRKKAIARKLGRKLNSSSTEHLDYNSVLRLDQVSKHCVLLFPQLHSMKYLTDLSCLYFSDSLLFIKKSEITLMASCVKLVYFSCTLAALVILLVPFPPSHHTLIRLCLDCSTAVNCEPGGVSYMTRMLVEAVRSVGLLIISPQNFKACTVWVSWLWENTCEDGGAFLLMLLIIYVNFL